ncbi:hypothetical protein cyc_03389 [Cyclospora cayetanensis]|uniref:Uncharacterized protein n=1 Tax=Cyclospora cayetanensis TaxID=88456 RepID=A0A1D3CZK2_9EIME|nr:hypothetical protein cyc_03389 [Cyclospora cayetanensis]
MDEVALSPQKLRKVQQVAEISCLSEQLAVALLVASCWSVQRAVSLHVEGRLWRLFGLRRCPSEPQTLPPSLILSIWTAKDVKHNGSYRVVVECGLAARRLSAWTEGTRELVPLQFTCGFPWVSAGEQLKFSLWRKRLVQDDKCVGVAYLACSLIPQEVTSKAQVGLPQRSSRSSLSLDLLDLFDPPTEEHHELQQQQQTDEQGVIQQGFPAQNRVEKKSVQQQQHHPSIQQPTQLRREPPPKPQPLPQQEEERSKQGESLLELQEPEQEPRLAYPAAAALDALFYADTAEAPATAASGSPTSHAAPASTVSQGGVPPQEAGVAAEDRPLFSSPPPAGAPPNAAAESSAGSPSCSRPSRPLPALQHALANIESSAAATQSAPHAARGAEGRLSATADALPERVLGTAFLSPATPRASPGDGAPAPSKRVVAPADDETFNGAGELPHEDGKQSGTTRCSSSCLVSRCLLTLSSSCLTKLDPFTCS